MGEGEVLSNTFKAWFMLYTLTVQILAKTYEVITIVSPQTNEPVTDIDLNLLSLHLTDPHTSPMIPFLT